MGFPTSWKNLSHKKLGKSVGALAGLASAVSVFVGTLAARSSPKGFAKLSVALHFSKTPLIVKLAPICAGVAVSIATAAGLLGFYTWLVEREESGAEPEEAVARDSAAQ
jgi:hypothetical protein